MASVFFFFFSSCCFRLRGIFEYFSVSLVSFYYKNLRIIVASTFSLSSSLSFSLFQSLRGSSVSACDDASPRKSSTTGAFFFVCGWSCYDVLHSAHSHFAVLVLLLGLVPGRPPPGAHCLASSCDKVYGFAGFSATPSFVAPFFPSSLGLFVFPPRSSGFLKAVSE